jgi:multidrug efflux pump subunit AcrB
MHEEKHTLYLTLVDGRVRTLQDIENLVVTASEGHPVRIKDFARVKVAEEPVYTVVTADGINAVLLNIRSQPDGSTLDIAGQLKKEIRDLKRELPPDMKLAFFYDQLLLVRDSVRSVWEAIIFGLVLSVVILFLFLKDWGSTLVAIVVIPVTVLITLVAMKLIGASFNLMTLGGIAAAIGLVIDDAIVVVEAIYTKMVTGRPCTQAIHEAIGEIFLPLAFLDGVPGVFFRALAITMTVSLLTSLALAITLTPSLAAWIIRIRPEGGPRDSHEVEQGGFVLRRVIALYELAVRVSLRHCWITTGICGLLLLAGGVLYMRLSSDFLPEMDEGGFVIDYVAPPGTSLSETDRALRQVERILQETPDVESYSRRTGAALGFHLVDPQRIDHIAALRDLPLRTPGGASVLLSQVADVREEPGQLELRREDLRERGMDLEEALVHSGRRRLRPVLMTSMAAALGMLPLAYGIGSGADTLRPLAIAVIGALCVSVLLSLVATPTVYFLMMSLVRSARQDPGRSGD